MGEINVFLKNEIKTTDEMMIFFEGRKLREYSLYLCLVGIKKKKKEEKLIWRKGSKKGGRDTKIILPLTEHYSFEIKKIWLIIITDLSWKIFEGN